MNAKELADTVVALGVGRQGTAISADGVGFYYTPTDENTHEEEGLYSKLFVRDWRVAGALMEKVEAKGYDFVADVQAGKQAIIRTGRWSGERCSTENTKGIGTDESLPRAIIEACVEALT